MAGKTPNVVYTCRLHRFKQVRCCDLLAICKLAGILENVSVGQTAKQHARWWTATITAQAEVYHSQAAERDHFGKQSNRREDFLLRQGKKIMAAERDHFGKQSNRRHIFLSRQGM